MILELSVRVATEAACSPVVVVLGASADLIRKHSDLRNAQIVLNNGWTEGMASSIRIGLAVMRNVEGIIIMTCDMPAVTSSHIRALAASGGMTASSYSGRLGVPAYLPQSMFPMLIKLHGDTGARDLLGTSAAIELLGGELDIDTKEALRIARERFG
ncbi:MAG TPA: nucleotidyltransferase family protein [Terracidiphilus sp.]